MLQFENKQIDSQHPFFQSAQLLQARWAVPQRQTQYAQTVTMNDLGEVFLGKHGSNQTRTDFSSYRKGDNARPKQTLLDAVHLVLPELKVFYELGPAGLPLWSAFAGKNSADDFWHHLKISKNFDLKRWSNLLTLMKDGFRNSATNQTIESTPWWIWGQSLQLAIVGKVSDEEILLHLEKDLGSIAKPKSIHRLSSLPLRGIGKIDREALAKEINRE